MKRLFLCSNKDEEKFLDNNSIGIEDVIFATTNYEYYVEKSKDYNEILFLEQDDSIPYKTIWEIINQINNVIKDCQLDNSLFYMLSYHYEHYMPKILMTMILNLRLLDKLVNEYFIEHFLIVDDKSSWKINEAIFLYAIAKNINYTIIDESTGKEKDCLFTLRESIYDKNSTENKCYEELEIQEERKINLWIQKENKLMIPNPKDVHQMGALYCGNDSLKHVRWEKQLLKILGEDTVVISFYKSDDNKIFENCGYKVYCLEEYFDKYTFINLYNNYRKDRKRLLDAIEHNLSIEYLGINLSHYIHRKAVNYFYREILQYIYLYSCAEHFFLKKCFGVISSWGTSNFLETRICYLNTREYNTQFFYISRTSVVAWENYEPWEDIVSLRIFPKGCLPAQMTSKRFRGEIYYSFDVLGGSDYYGKKLCSENKHMPTTVRIAFLPSYPFEGVKTFRNYENNCKVIIEELLKSGCIINFKNHPGICQYLDDQMRKRYSPIHNLHFIDRFQSGDAVIQDSDIVITDASLVIFDAASYQKPVFIMAAGAGYELIKQHKEGFLICATPQELCAKISRIIEDKEKYEERTKAIIEKQNYYLERLYGKCDTNAEKAIYKIIREKISK